jgi:hypothetical protein
MCRHEPSITIVQNGRSLPAGRQDLKSHLKGLPNMRNRWISALSFNLIHSYDNPSDF